MRNQFLNRIISCVLIAGLTLITASCGEKKEGEEEKSSKSEESDTIPEPLTKIEEGIEGIIKALNGPAITKEKEEAKKEEGDKEEVKKETPPKQEEGTPNEEGASKDKPKDEGALKEEGASKDKPKDEGAAKEEGAAKDKPKEEDAKKEEGAPKEPPADPWKKISPMVNDLHYTWNAYSPAAAKKGASTMLIDNFSSFLNSLTNTVLSKNTLQTLIAANNLYSYIPDFYSLYETKTSPEIKRVRYFTRNVVLHAMSGEWDKTDVDITNLKASWVPFKNTLPKDQSENTNTMQLSIQELEKVVKTKNLILTDIKARVAMSNIEAIEKALEKLEKEKKKE